MRAPGGPARGIRADLAARGLHPRRRLGQCFLADPGIRARIVEAVGLAPDDLVVEIGPGTGALTGALLARARWVLAVEIDAGLCQLLRERFADRPWFELRCADALRFDFRGALAVAPPPPRPARLVGNLPYGVATPLLLRLLQAPDLFADLTVMVQREVAERLTARPGTRAYGALTVACRYRAAVRTLFRVSPEAFTPRPAVESAVVRLQPRAEPAPRAADERLLFRVVRGAFAQRRKTVRNALLGVPGLEAPTVAAALRAAGIDPGRRGETLSLEEFVGLADALAGRWPGAGEGRCRP